MVIEHFSIGAFFLRMESRDCCPTKQSLYFKASFKIKNRRITFDVTKNQPSTLDVIGISLHFFF